MNPQINMSGMNQVGGPVGAPRAMNNGPGGIPRSVNAEESKDPKFELDSYIYDYFVKTEQYEIARAMKNSGIRLNLTKETKTSPSRREVNGLDEPMDADSKDDMKNRPDDLPPVNVGGGDLAAPFLHEWWCIFWDICQAHRNRGANGAATQYLIHTQQRARAQQMEREQMLRQLGPGMLNQQYRTMVAGMQTNGMAMPSDLQKRAMANNARNPGQQMANMRTFSQQPSQLMQTQMQRNGSGMDMDAQQRPQSPSSVDNAPSPKRQRLEGQLNGPPMGPAGRAQMGMQNQFANFQNQGPEVRNKSMQIYSRQMAQSVESAMNNQTMLKGMPNGAGLQQGAGMIPQDPQMPMNEYYAGNPAAMRGGLPQNAQGGNHALQDYQMQLMLLEQQNKKRLMMARQEQDSMARVDGQPGPGGPPGGGGQPNFAPGMSPQGSRAGPSPGPNEQMKRGTPKMGQSGLPPSPLPDGSMPQGRGSPGPMNFDPGQMPPNMPPQFYPNMGQMGDAMGGGPGSAMMRPPNSHPNFAGQMNPQQLEAMSRQPNGARMVGNWPQGPGPGQMIHQIPPQPQSQGTPQQRNAAMPPPQAPAAGAGRTQPSSPQQPAAPPTPSQSTKAAPKPKKDAKANKKQTKKTSMTTNATPSSEAEPPATPTPATPITPMHQQSFNNANNSNGQKSGPSQQTSASAPAPVPAPAPPMPAPQPDLSQAGPPFGSIDGTDNGGLNFEFGGLDGTDVLDGFDFDQFLNPDAGGGDFAFDPTLALNFGTDGVEAGSGDV